MAEVTIYGAAFTIPESAEIAVGVPMNEGHVKALQASRVAAVRNRFTQSLKDKEFDVAATQADINKAAEAFQFGVSMRGKGGGRRITDPVEREAISMARATISMAYEAKYDTKPEAEALRAETERLMGLRGDDFRKRAQRALRDREAASTDVLDLLGVSAPAAQEPEAQAA